MKTARILVFLCLVPIVVLATDSYVEKMIRVADKNGRSVASAYDAYLTLLVKKSISKDKIDFPTELLIDRPEYFVLERTYYISPNEMRGFSLALPKKAVKASDGRVQSTSDLALKEESIHQGIHVLVLKEKRVEQGAAPLPPALKTGPSEGAR